MSPRRRTQPMPAEEPVKVHDPKVALGPASNSKGLLDLPAELIEDVLVVLAELDSPTTIAALAYTCKSLRKLIYSPEDKHLWRRIFLTTFDDPRQLVEDVELEEHTYSWAYEYQSRIHALRVFERRSVERMTPGKRVLRRKPSANDHQATEPRYDYSGTLEALLSTLHSAMPVPPPGDGEERRHPWEDLSLCSRRLKEAADRAPAHPPYLQSAQEDSKTSTTGAYFVPPSKNIAFLKRVFSLGIIPDLVNHIGIGISAQEPPMPPHLSASSSSSFVDAREHGTSGPSSTSSRQYATSEREALNQLIAVFGISPFLAKPNLHDTPSGELLDIGPDVRLEDTLYRSGLTGGRLETRSTEITEAFSRIRLGAQSEVYRMRYLNPRRAYAPFLCVPVEDEGAGESDSSDDEDTEDADYVPPPDHDHEHSDDDLPELDEAPILIAIPTAHRPRPHPSAAELRADWEHLAAIRVVVQARLEERMKSLHATPLDWTHPGRLDDFRRTLVSWESVRAGVWSAGPKHVRNEEDGEAPAASGSSSSAEASTIPMSPSEPQVEWDWAGVQGVWRRAVCWLDYHDLIYHNTRGFAGAKLDEATVTVPLVLHVTGFSPSPSPLYKNFPTIHFDSKRYPMNTMGGAGWGAGDEPEDVRRVKGTVKVCGDGSIWWSMVSSQAGTQNEWEWASEGVQIGTSLVPGTPRGMRSGCGILGLWTGWEHEPEDPIGAWWQWRVA